MATRPRISQQFLDEQRDKRIVAAAIAQIGSRDYGSVTVADIVRQAGIARNTFYDGFRSKEHVFSTAVSQIVATAEQNVEESGDVLGALVDFVHSEPEKARCLLIEAPRALPDVYESLIAGVAERLQLEEPMARLVAGGVESILRRAAGSEETVDVDGLRAFVAPHFEAVTA